MQVIRPDIVPSLDLARVHERLAAEEDAEEEDEEEGEYLDEAELLAAEAGHPYDPNGNMVQMPYHGCCGEMPPSCCGGRETNLFGGNYDEGDFDEGSDDGMPLPPLGPLP
jgi:hypothetical protein